MYWQEDSRFAKESKLYIFKQNHPLASLMLVSTADSGPRIGIGMCMCCQHPLQIIERELDILCSLGRHGLR